MTLLGQKVCVLIGFGATGTTGCIKERIVSGSDRIWRIDDSDCGQGDISIGIVDVVVVVVVVVEVVVEVVVDGEIVVRGLEYIW